MSRKKQRGSSLNRETPYSLEEVSAHNKKDDLWVVVKNKVYNVTKWINIHPGGHLILLAVGGQDATEAFLGFHPPEIFESHLPKFQIGIVSDPVKSPLREDFERLRDTFRKEGLYEPDYSFYILKTIIFIIHFYAAIWATLHSTNAWHYLVSGALLGLFWQQLSFFGHDFGHNSASQSRDVDCVFSIFQTMFYGVSAQWWKRSHNVHHTVTNSIDYDPDIQHLPLMAISEEMFGGYFSFYHMRDFIFTKTARFFVAQQHHFYFVLMAFARFNLYFQSWLLCLNMNEKVRFRLGEIGAMSFYCMWNVYLVYLIPTWTNRLVFVMISHWVCGIVHCQITISHFALPSYWGPGYDTASKPNHWVEMQLETSMDVDCPWYMDWFHGGLQFQVEHHLFPRIPRNRLRYIKHKYILPLIKEHGLHHQSMDFLQCIGYVYTNMKREALKARDYCLCGTSVQTCGNNCNSAPVVPKSKTQRNSKCTKKCTENGTSKTSAGLYDLWMCEG